MFNGGMTMGPSLADIAAITNRQNDDGNGFNNGWWILILLMAMYGGFGGYGYGGYGNNGREATATQADIQRGFDTQAAPNLWIEPESLPWRQQTQLIW